MKARTVTAANAEQQLAAFINKFSPSDQRLIRARRRALRSRFPTANEPVFPFLRNSARAEDAPAAERIPRRNHLPGESLLTTATALAAHDIRVRRSPGA